MQRRIAQGYLSPPQGPLKRGVAVPFTARGDAGATTRTRLQLRYGVPCEMDDCLPAVVRFYCRVSLLDVLGVRRPGKSCLPAARRRLHRAISLCGASS